MSRALPSRDAPFRRDDTALLLVDMQRIWLEPDPGAKNQASDADADFFRAARERLVPQARRVLAAARAARIEVLHTVIRSLTVDGRDRSLDHKLTPIHVAPDDPRGDPVAGLGPVGDEIVLAKTSSGVFNSTAIDYLLRNLGVRNLAVAGVMTDQCVDMAVRDAADRGYLVTCVHDACLAPTPERHAAALRVLAGYCRLAETDRVVALLGALATGHRTER